MDYFPLFAEQRGGTQGGEFMGSKRRSRERENLSGAKEGGEFMETGNTKKNEPAPYPV
jgi:hypothetical protein